MSKTRRKESSELEYFRGKLKKLESENRSLKKRLKQLDKRAHFYEDIVDEVAEEMEVKNLCPVCKKGTMILLDLKYVKFVSCDTCDHKQKL